MSAAAFYGLLFAGNVPPVRCGSSYPGCCILWTYARGKFRDKGSLPADQQGRL
ncbi:hypothetical protein HMPREF1986_01519 [Oribacterium sp. oral taxon 078 str. F0263]|nr:hypothetical protein HMPREF1986_01519 [Oribacterium sp. oral taxon 078 str. F0263]